MRLIRQHVQGKQGPDLAVSDIRPPLSALSSSMIRFGPAGWDYKDWWGKVYPATRRPGFDPLTYLSRFFDTIEINSTFYGAGSAKAAEGWTRRVGHNKNFKFTAKLWQRFTHERDTAWSREDVAAPTDTFKALAGEDRLGAVVAQFPWSFKRDQANQEWLDDVLGAFADFPLTVEVRHSSWNDPSFYEKLAARNVGIVNIDQPLFRHSIKPGAAATGSIGYVRLHGRNYENWFRDSAETHERYDYLYSADDLRGWLDRVHEIASHTRETYVITNNHYLGQAVVNAAMLKKLYGEKDVAVPPELAEAYEEELEPLGIHAAPENELRLL